MNNSAAPKALDVPTAVSVKGVKILTTHNQSRLSSHYLARLSRQRTHFFVKEKVRSRATFQNGTSRDLAADSGSAASNRTIYDWAIVRSDRQSGAFSAAVGAPYLRAGMVRCGSLISF